MRASLFAIFDRSGFVEARKTGKFELKPGQVATEIVIEIPDEAFKPALIPTVTVSLPVDALRRSYEAVVQEGPAE